jgi:hypothetical protein
VEFVGVAWAGDESRYQEFVDSYDLSFPQINDDSATVFTDFGIAGQPAFALVRPDGEVERLLGAASGEILDSIIEDALA